MKVDENEDWVRDLLPRTWVSIGHRGLSYCVHSLMVDYSFEVPRWSGIIAVKVGNRGTSSTYWSDKLYTEKAVRQALFRQIYWVEQICRRDLADVS